MRSLTLSLLSADEAEVFYNRYLIHDFPPTELKPFSSMRRMLQVGIYQPLGVFEGGEPVGYAFLTVIPEKKAALLDYLGVLPNLRSRGLGAEILSMLAARYTGQLCAILIESEFPPESPEPKTAERRLTFYRRAGARQTGVDIRVFGVRYVLFALSCNKTPFSDSDTQKSMETIYRAMLPPLHFCKNIFLGEAARHPEYNQGAPME